MRLRYALIGGVVSLLLTLGVMSMVANLIRAITEEVVGGILVR
jgi:hypothetical protein